ncbi:phage portal protein [Phycicoccus jejuensis]|uniref:phage portal protein n=1 Tax=Phycicoccus jejuensis TaxID=367299 RepID=UPI00068FF888|nr:phage portal protein [Phycicoccus jejuensis]
MGTITYYVDGLPVTISDRTYSMTDALVPVDQRAYKAASETESIDELWRKQPHLRMVTSFLAENIAQVPMHAFGRKANGDRDKLPATHPLARAVRMPDPPRLTAYELMHTLVLDVCLRDRYAAVVIVGEDGRARIVRMPPATWKFERDSTKLPTSITAFRSDGTAFSIPLDRALWIDGYPSDENTSPIESLRGILAEAELAASYRRDLWQNGGRMPGWIGRPKEAGGWSPDARDKFTAGWQRYASGGVRAGRTPILEDGMEYHELATGITPENGEQLESRKLSIAEVANAFHIPPQMVGQDAKSSYNSVTGYREMLYSDTLGTWFERLDQAFNMRLVPQLADPDEMFVEFNVAAKLRLAFEDQARIFQTTTGGPIMTRAEARRRLNLPHIEGTDELIVPLNVLEGGQASATDSSPDKPANGGGASGGSGASGSGRTPSPAEVVQKVYLGVDKVITTAEARQLINDAGADLALPGPDFGGEA